MEHLLRVYHFHSPFPMTLGEKGTCQLHFLHKETTVHRSDSSPRSNVSKWLSQSLGPGLLQPKALGVAPRSTLKGKKMGKVL